MARMAWVVVPNYPHHVTQRGNRRQKTFFRDTDYKYYLELMSVFSRKAGTEIWAYCLMPNHVHLLMVPSEENALRAAFGEVHRRYTGYINCREGWRGHLWQERFHSFVMDEEYLLATVRYVERNPVAARLCDKPEQWRWSSAQAHIEGKADGLVRVQPMLGRIDDWHSYFTDSNEPSVDDQVIRKHARTGRPLGAKAFISDLELLTGKRLARRKPGPAPR